MSDDAYFEKFEATPLIAFSLYTAIQAQSLQRVGERLLSISKDWDATGASNDHLIYYDYFWLWVLGAYEVLRTMDEKNSMFAENVAIRTRQLKIEIAKLRMPFAKQELRGNGGPIYAENSIAGVKHGLVFKIGDQTIHSDLLVRDVLDHLGSIELCDIKSALPVRRS